MALLRKKLGYQEMFQAVARFVEKERLRDVCLLEVEGGVVVQGYGLVDTKEGWSLALKTQTLSYADLQKLLKQR